MGLIDSLGRYFKGKAQPEEVAEAANAALPREVSGRDAVLERRRRLQQMEQQTESDEARSARLRAEALKGE
jgi:hypothetical protein